MIGVQLLLCGTGRVWNGGRLRVRIDLSGSSASQTTSKHIGATAETKVDSGSRGIKSVSNKVCGS